MKDGQEAIYYLIADDPDALARSPQIEGFRARGVEVLLLSDQVDAFWPDQLGRFDEKPLRSITQGSIDLSAFAVEGESKPPAEAGDLVTALKEALAGDVSDVRATDRLVDSAVVRAAASGGPDLQLQRLMRRAGRGLGAGMPVLEINPRHALIRALAARLAAGEAITDEAGTLLDLARVQDGDTPRDPAGFARRIAAVLGASLGTPA
jgi:molecular chaperone HtpG